QEPEPAPQPKSALPSGPAPQRESAPQPEMASQQESGLREERAACPPSDTAHDQGGEALSERDSTGTEAADDRIDINAADVVALQQLPGVGPVLAQRIVDHRERWGPFFDPMDLLEVRGIGEATLRR